MAHHGPVSRVAGSLSRIKPRARRPDVCVVVTSAAPEDAPTAMLVVDGDPIDAASARRRALRAFDGIDVAMTATLAGALALAEAREAQGVRLSAMLVELELPDADRAAGIARLRGCFPEVALVALGDGDPELDASRALDAGAHEYLAKDDLCVERLRRAVRRAQARLARELDRRRRERTDAVTGLPNALGLMERLERAVDRAVRGRAPQPALICVALDGLARINRMGGRGLGDALLRHAAERLRGHLERDEYAARLEGGVFAVLRSGESPDDDEAFAGVLAAALAEPFDAQRERLHLLPRVGFARWRPRMSAVALLQAGDAALREGNAPLVHVPARSTTTDDPALRRRLAHAALDEFSVAYQPSFDAVRGAPVNVEALLRWTPADEAPVPAASFLGALESSGAILRVGAWVLDEACHACSQWRARGSVAGVSVNLSPLQISDPGLVDKVARALDAAALPADALTLEISERASLDQLELAEGQLVRLRTLGVRIALDDFGASTASLRHLQRLPFDVLKIDRRFAGLTLAHDREFVSGLAGMAHALGMRVVAEGVETATQRHALTACGCDELQGYLLARPQASWEALLGRGPGRDATTPAHEAA